MADLTRENMIQALKAKAEYFSDICQKYNMDAHFLQIKAEQAAITSNELNAMAKQWERDLKAESTDASELV